MQERTGNEWKALLHQMLEQVERAARKCGEAPTPSREEKMDEALMSAARTIQRICDQIDNN